jgi:hypothetical protein
VSPESRCNCDMLISLSPRPPGLNDSYAVAGEIIWCVIVRDTSMFEEAKGVLQHLVTAAIKEGSFYEAARHTLRMGLNVFAQVHFLLHVW